MPRSVTPVLLALAVLAAATLSGRAAQDPRAILLRDGPVNASASGTSWWLANHSLVATWDTSPGLRVSSVFDRLGGRTGTKPGEAFTITAADGRVINGSTCTLQEPPVLDDVGETVGAPPGRRLAATFVCAGGEMAVRWQAELQPGADMARQTAVLSRGQGTVAVSDVGYPPDSARPDPTASAEPARVLAGPYLQLPTQTSMTVMWVTEGPAAAWVEYGPDHTTPNRAMPVSDGLVEAGGRIHKVPLEHLRPDTVYTYRTVTRSIINYGPYKVDYGPISRGEPRQFRTLAVTRPTYSFLVMNDLHENTTFIRAHAARQAGHAPYDLVFFNGDSLSHLESEQQILERCLQPAADAFASRVPLMLVRGNHETRGKLARQLKDYLALPGGRYYYSFDHGPVHFLVLDTGEDKEDGHWAYSGLTDFDAYRNAEAEWLKHEVQTAAFRNATYRVLVAHMPFFGNERTRVSGHGPTHNREQFGAILNDAGIDLHIAGHTHRADWVAPMTGRNTFPISVGGGSQPGTNTVTRVDVSPSQLVVTLTADDGTVVGTHSVMARKR
ncbi:MAG: metallophosphoesterase family protein [Vicinamibacterales bacterium]|nr:metallophosphoesterase family protein [Vicinamibacterales bacterium]